MVGKRFGEASRSALNESLGQTGIDYPAPYRHVVIGEHLTRRPLSRPSAVHSRRPLMRASRIRYFPLAATMIPSPYLARSGIVTGKCPLIPISPHNAFTAAISDGGTVLNVAM